MLKVLSSTLNVNYLKGNKQKKNKTTTLVRVFDFHFGKNTEEENTTHNNLKAFVAYVWAWIKQLDMKLVQTIK